MGPGGLGEALCATELAGSWSPTKWHPERAPLLPPAWARCAWRLEHGGEAPPLPTSPFLWVLGWKTECLHSAEGGEARLKSRGAGLKSLCSKLSPLSTAEWQ